VRVNVRNILAQCPKCGADDFATGGGKRFGFASQTVMRCTACGTTATYIELMIQIADKALAMSAATLEQIRRRNR
jgi:hypothetical protein